MWDTIVKPFAALVVPILDKFFPDKLNDAQKAQIQAEIENQVAKQALTQDSAFRSFTLALEGKAEDVPNKVKIARAMVRPRLTYGIVIAFLLYSVAMFLWPPMVGVDGKLFHLELYQSIGNTLEGAMYIVLGFYFGSRTVEKFLPALMNRQPVNGGGA